MTTAQVVISDQEVIPTDKTIVGQKVTLAEYSKISEKFTEPDVYQIDTRQILTTLSAPDFDSQLKIQLGTQQDWDLELYPVEMLSPDYKLRVVTERGIEEHPVPEIKTYYGYLKGRPETDVRVTIMDGFLYGFVEDGDQTIYFEPAERFQSNLNQGEVIVYRPDQVVTNKVGTCAHTERADKTITNSNSSQTLTAAGACFELDLAIATDYSYYLDRGSNIGAVTAATLGVMNNVAANYELNGNTNFADGIEFLIVENFVVTTPNGDPWTASTNASVLLPDFRDWANAGTGFSAIHDLGQLWTDRDFDGTTVGLAYTSVNVICGNSRYHILQDYTPNAEQLRVLTAHEIGHNFGAEHDASGSGFIMAPSVNLTNTWSQASKNSANQAISNASTGGNACLVACSDRPPFSAFTASIDCGASAVTFFDNSSGDPTSWNWSFPGGTPSSSTLQNPTVVYNEGSYDVTLTASNELGTGTTETRTDFVDIVQSPIGACIPGGNSGNGGIYNFRIGDINSTSGNAQQDGGFYLDNSCSQVTDLDPNTTYAVVFEVGTFDPNGSTFNQLRIYIDFNNDGDFTDADELIASSGGTGFGGGLRTFDYTTPATPPVSGVNLRMRVVADQSVNSPCQTISNGQIEDYGITFPGMAPLPVTLTSYKAAPENKFSLLNWTTESEYNNDYYILEHSTDGRNFEFLDEISGQGTVNQISKYEYLHKTPIIGDNYYRLTQTDFDGTQEVLGTRVVNFKTDEVIVNIQPNPMSDQMLRTAYISPVDGLLELTVIGVDGKIIKQINQEILSGTTMIDLDLPGLSHGVYFLRTAMKGTVKTNRFVKTN